MVLICVCVCAFVNSDQRQFIAVVQGSRPKKISWPLSREPNFDHKTRSHDWHASKFPQRWSSRNVAVMCNL